MLIEGKPLKDKPAPAAMPKKEEEKKSEAPAPASDKVVPPIPPSEDPAPA